MKMGGVSKTLSRKAKCPNDVRGTSMENRFERTSRLATLVPVTKFPLQTPPRATSSDENRIATMRGGSFARSIGAADSRDDVPTLTLAGIRTGCVAHPETTIEHANDATSRRRVILARVGIKGPRFLQLVGVRVKQSTPRNLAFDYAVGICSVWIASGFFLDAWAHGHVPIESFFTPYHAVFYTGMLAMGAVIATFVLRRRARGMGWRACLPPGYHLAILGIPIFFLAGIGDLCWHLLLGIEEGVDALLSPTHQALGLGIFFVSMGPIRSVLADRSRATGFVSQAPLLLGLIAWLLLVHFGTAYAFDPGAGRTNAPPSIAVFTPDYLTAVAIGYYKSSLSVLTLIFQSAIVAGFALWCVSRLRVRPGFFTLLYVLGNAPAAAAFTNDTPLLLVTIVQSLVAGIVADVLVARFDPQPERARYYRWFAVLVPLAYSGAYLLATLATDRLWWDWNVSLGAWIWTGVAGFALSLVGTARRSAS